MNQELPTSARRLLQAFPLVAALLPAWMAWHLTCPIPHADHWFCIAEPYLQLKQGASFWGLVHLQGNDSRLDVLRLIGFALVKFTNWDLRAESLTCVGLGLMTAFSLGHLIRKNGSGGAFWIVAIALLGMGLVLTPHQWMNWTFGVQTCYLAVVLFTLLVVLCFESGLPIALRALAAGGCAFVATHSFVNGWLAWILGTLCLARVLWIEPKNGRNRSIVLALWAGLFVINVLIYFQGYGAGTSAVHDKPLFARILADPMSFANFFVRVLGAPFSDYGWGLDRDSRFLMNIRLATSVTTVSLLLFVATLWSVRRMLLQKEAWPFLMLCLYGLGNACAVTLARTGMVASGPFQSRYIAYTLWFYVGLLGLLGLTECKRWQVIRWAWFGVLLAGYLIGIPQGFREGRRDFDRSQNIVASGELRHVAVEPVFLDSINPSAGPVLLAHMDQLEALGLLHIPTIRSPKVKDASISAPGTVEGELKSGEMQSDGLFLRGWAMKKQSREAADAIVISMQVDGQEEEWLGIAQRRIIESKLCKKHQAVADEDRIGWAYKPGFRSEKATLSELPNPFRAKAIPAGNVTFRAYAMDVKTGSFAPLGGSVSMEMK